MKSITDEQLVGHADVTLKSVELIINILEALTNRILMLEAEQREIIEYLNAGGHAGYDARH